MSEQGPGPDGPHGQEGPYGQEGPGWGQPAQGQPAPPPPYGQQPPPYGQPAPPYGQPAPAPYGYVDPAAPFGRHPRTGEPYGDKSKIIAGLLQLLVGVFGVGRFYTGHTGMAIAQLLTCGGLGIWSLIDGIILLVGDDARDARGRLLRS